MSIEVSIASVGTLKHYVGY